MYYDIMLPDPEHANLSIWTEDSKQDEMMRSNHLRVCLLDVNRFIKANNIQEVTNPVTFARNNVPTSDGLLSNEIFGITMSQRSTTCAYIDLGEYFLSPIVYKVWSKLDKKIIDCIHGTDYFIINGKGELQSSPDGKTGIKFLKDNFSRLNIARTTSTKRDMNVDFIEACKKDPGTWINKLVISPAYYRDVDTSKGGRVSLGEVNELYRNLIIASRSLKESKDYGLDMSDSTRGRIQELLVKIYDWYGNGTTINGNTTGANIPGKRGVIRRAVMSKTTDYGSRLVITAPELKYENYDDVNVNLQYSSLPLASTLNNFRPFIIFWLKRYFEKLFSVGTVLPIKLKDGSTSTLSIKDYQSQFSEERIDREIKRFLTGTTNRFVPITVELSDEDKILYKRDTFPLRFKGVRTTWDEFKRTGINDSVTLNRTLTWCDVFYQAASDVVKDKHIVVVRYPMDSIYNQFYTRVRVSSTNSTEPMLLDDVYYPEYPRIREEDIGKNTSNTFIDSLSVSNLYLEGIGGDYDGDQVTVKGIFTDEANAELEEIMKANYTYIDASGKGIRVPTNESIQAMYNLTLVLPDDQDKLTKPTFKK